MTIDLADQPLPPHTPSPYPGPLPGPNGPAQRPVNPWAALGALALWLRSEGILPNDTEWTAESSRRRVALMRELLAEHGIESVTAVERAARHAAAEAVQA